MAKKRMVSTQIVDSDDFLDMPLSSQALYLHLLVRADDEGFINGVKKIMRMIGARDDDMKVLITKNFLLPFESGVVVIKHWLIHNAIRQDRIIPTAHIDEKQLLGVKENNAYTLNKPLLKVKSENVRQVSDKCHPSIGLGLDLDLVEFSIDLVKNKQKIYYENLELNNLFLEFLELRKTLKAKNTDRAIKLLITKLGEVDDKTKIKMIEQSILNSYKGVFPIKTNNNNQYNKTKETKKPEWLDEFNEEMFGGE